MPAGTCHCGAVRIEIPRKPRALTSCNCSICRRYGTLWAYYRRGTVRIDCARGALDAYAWGDRHLKFVRCRVCGCVTHWEPMRVAAHHRIGVTMRNFEPALVGPLRVRRLDGAETWNWLD